MKDTFDILSRVRPHIRAMKPYVVKEVGCGVICMDKNENPYELPDELKRSILDAALAKDWGRYPPVVAFEFHRTIASYAGWKPEGVVAGNGSDELILTVLMTFLAPGSRLVIPSPTFAMYRHVGNLLEAKVEEVPLNEDYSYDPDAIERAFLAGGDLLIVCSPNNPTGCLFPLDRLERMLKGTSAPVIVDEAYYEFSKVTALKFLNRYPNLVILRTFSKAFSLAGQRIGYALTSPELATEILKAKIPFNMDVFSTVAATKLLENPSVIDRTIQSILDERDRISAAMRKIEGLTVYPTASNFILFRTPYESTAMRDDILNDGILVRDLSAHPLLKRTLRVTASRPSENDLFLRSLTRIMNERGRG